MKSYKELSVMDCYKTLVATFAETTKESRSFEYVYGVIAKYWNGKKGVPVGYKDLFTPLGYATPTDIKKFVESATKRTNPNVPDCFYNEKGLLCRCVLSPVYVGKGKERTTKKDENGNVVKENKYTPVRSYSVKVLLDLFMQIDNENNERTK